MAESFFEEDGNKLRFVFEFAFFAKTIGVEEESTYETKVFEEAGHLHLTLFSAPLHVEHEGSEKSKDNQHPSCRTGTVVE